MESAWDFVEKYYPGYSGCNKIAQCDDLEKLVNNEFEDGDCASDLLQNEYDGDVKNPQIEIDYDVIHKEVYIEAIEGYIETLKEK